MPASLPSHALGVASTPDGASPFSRMLQHELLSPAEEIKLGKRARRGCVNSINRLVLCNVKLVVHWAHASNYSRSPATLEDLTSAGITGLREAAMHFDPTNGKKNPNRARFASYAQHYVRRAIRVHLQAMQVAPMNIRTTGWRRMNEIKATRRQLADKLQRDPTEEEIADALNWPLWRVHHMQALQMAVALDAPVSPLEGAAAMHDILADEAPCPGVQSSDRDMMAVLGTSIRELDDRMQLVLRLRYGLGESGREHTLDEVGKILGRTRERVRQIESKALRILRNRAHQQAHPLSELVA